MYVILLCIVHLQDKLNIAWVHKLECLCAVCVLYYSYNCSLYICEFSSVHILYIFRIDLMCVKWFLFVSFNENVQYIHLLFSNPYKKNRCGCHLPGSNSIIIICYGDLSVSHFFVKKKNTWERFEAVIWIKQDG